MADFGEKPGTLDLLSLLGQNAGNFMMHPAQQSRRAFEAARDMAGNFIAPMQAATPLDPGARPGLAPEVQAEMPRQAQNTLVEALLRQRMQQGQ